MRSTFPVIGALRAGDSGPDYSWDGTHPGAAASEVVATTQ